MGKRRKNRGKNYDDDDEEVVLLEEENIKECNEFYDYEYASNDNEGTKDIYKKEKQIRGGLIIPWHLSRYHHRYSIVQHYSKDGQAADSSVPCLVFSQAGGHSGI